MGSKSLTIKEIEARLQNITPSNFEAFERSLVTDERLGVKAALSRARARIEAEQKEIQRIDALFSFDASFSDGVVLGLDEVGRGPVAGPLAVGGVVLGHETRSYIGLNDSKQVSEQKRIFLSEQIIKNARAYAIVYIQASEIDQIGMSAALRKAFLEAIHEIERQGVVPDTILLDGNKMHLDKREVNIVKGDTKSASIAAASIIAKVARDDLMHSYTKRYPGYGFESNVGYATNEHISAIRCLGLCPLHRKSFCSGFLQESLF